MGAELPPHATLCFGHVAPQHASARSLQRGDTPMSHGELPPSRPASPADLPRKGGGAPSLPHVHIRVLPRVLTPPSPHRRGWCRRRRGRPSRRPRRRRRIRASWACPPPSRPPP